MEAARNHILQKYRLSPDMQLGRGMEAEVYAYGPDAVLKLYTGAANQATFLILKAFYDTVDRQLVPYALPRIHTVIQEEGFLITIEQRLVGTQMAAILPSLTAGRLDGIMQSYLTAALALSRLQAPPAFDRYKLLDPERISQQAGGDWHAFLGRYLSHKLAQVSPLLSRDVPQFAAKTQQLHTILAQPYRGDDRLIHGDFFPGNLLINDDYQITALLDFGLLTMYGDYLFDMATSWVFFDMYDELKAGMRDRYLSMLLERLGENVRGKLYRYVLIYSILSANMYSSDCTDGHYHWCVANLSNQHYWNGIE